MTSMVSSSSSIAGSSSRLPTRDDALSLTSFNPFAEEDENDQSSYTLVASLFSRVKNSITAAAASGSQPSTTTPNAQTNGPPVHPPSVTSPKQPSVKTHDKRPPPTPRLGNHASSRSIDKTSGKFSISNKPAQPLVSLTPVVSELPSVNTNSPHPDYYDGAMTPNQTGSPYAFHDTPDSHNYATSIPGFPIPDDARSIRTTMSLKRSASVSKIMRRIRGEGLSRDYWMDDETCKECYDCKSIFTAWRRKHHCRICGLIYCSRCASNIIKGSRFGQDGMIRVCNLCLDQIAKVDEDEDQDDRRSIASAATSSFPDIMTLGYGGRKRHPLMSSHGPQSPFNLFGKADEPFNLFSIAETRRTLSFGSDDSALNSRPGSPDAEIGIEALGVPARAAPFRRSTFPDDDKDTGVTVIEPDQPAHIGSSLQTQTRSPIDFPRTMAVPQVGPSSIQFPGSSSDQGGDYEGPFSGGLVRSRFNSLADVDALPTPFIRSRVQSRLMDSLMGEPGWRTRRDSVAYAKELNLISMAHLRTMLKQMLKTEGIPNIDEWEETLLKLALRIAKEMTFTAFPQRQGQDMDVRRYVKIKKIPGGAPKDSEYVDGAVITKNVAHKHMARSHRNPRVMLVTFPLEFHRVENQYMPFSQIMRQEKEYLGNLASRIAAVRPHIILAEKSVSGIALEALAKHNIAVARSVKPSAIQLVSRVTQADIVSSMDKLLEPRFGHCSRFKIQTFDHPLIPGRRKTYMRFEGCNPSMGCTILLRGGDSDTLTRIKRITRLLAFIVRNLKLETHLWKDSIISVPNLAPGAAPQSYINTLSVRQIEGGSKLSLDTNSSVAHTRESSLSSRRSGSFTVWGTDSEPVQDEEVEQDRVSRRIQASLEPYLNTFISASATLRFPPPQPLRKMKELDDMLYRDKRAWEDEIIAREEQGKFGHAQEETITPGSYLSVSTVSTSGTTTALPTPMISRPAPVAKLSEESATTETDIKALIDSLPAPDIKTPSPDLKPSNRIGSGYFDRPISASPAAPSTPAEDVQLVFKTINDVTLESQLSHTRWLHAEQRRVWEWYLRRNKDDFVVEKYQRITLWEARTPISKDSHHSMCVTPMLKYITFYGDNDCTLGKFIEKSVHDTVVQTLDPKAMCPGVGCGLPLARHCTIYLHNETRLSVAVEPWDDQLGVVPSPEMITTWSVCRVCGSTTPFIQVSEEMQRYSFAKFLELHFYPAEVKLVLGAGCEHNIYQDHVRYFACGGMTIRFQAEAIKLFEIVYPPRHIHIRPETLLALKNSDYEHLLAKYATWYSELIDELQFISIDATTGEEESDHALTLHINLLISKADAERTDFQRLLNRVYNDSSPYDTLALNQVRAHRQDKLVAWQEEFDKLPRLRHGGAERSSRVVSAFGTMRGMFPRRTEWMSDYQNASSSVSDAEDAGPFKKFITSMSSVESASEPDSKATSPKPSSPKALITAPATRVELQSSISTESASTSAISQTTDQPAETEGDSDSTIGALKTESRYQVPTSEAKRLSPETDADGPQSASEMNKDGPSIARVGPAPSKLPRRISHYPSVAELVRKYQDYLPPQGVQELTKTAFAPTYPPSESEAEYPQNKFAPRSILRSRGRGGGSIMKKPSMSDFEHGYAANVAPKYLTHRARPGLQSRLAGAMITNVNDSDGPSRRRSPEKRLSEPRDDDDTAPRAGPSGAATKSTSPPVKVTISGARAGKGKPPPRLSAGKEKAPQSRSTSIGPAPRSSNRRTSLAPGNRVTHLTKQFEKINKEVERNSRRYNVIRGGRRARPVATARARVQVLESVKDAIYDEPESSDSSEADSEDNNDADEDDDKEPRVPRALRAPKTPIEPASEGAEAEEVPNPTAPLTTPEAAPTTEVTEPDSQEITVPSISQNTAGETSTGMSVPPSPFMASLPGLRQPPPDLDLGERNSILRALSGFWGQQPFNRMSRLDLDGDDPMADPEHIFRDSSMVVRTDEPTSIIALALNSPQYRDMLSKSRAEKRQVREPKINETGEAFMPDDRSVAESNSTWGLVNMDSMDTGNPTEEMRKSSSKLPWAISFDSGNLTISCTVLFPEQFDALRRTYGCDKSMVESLARCIKWDASGGKSGSGFLKTRDERFIAKDISRSELQTMATFAPAYFDYMSSSVTHSRPTLLAKIFGCFKITFKKTSEIGNTKSRTTHMNLLVMENLFYSRRFSTIYDLKGSTRNRHAQSTGRENEVLLDENLVELSHITPLFLREHSKRILRSALYNDSKFLSDVNVMDYSLVAGLDSKNGELVVGIVDYQRTYTWDKKLESWVKDSGFLGAGRGEPTIITPKQYRQRFMAAMERYFPLVPDRWMKQQDAPEETNDTSDM